MSSKTSEESIYQKATLGRRFGSYLIDWYVGGLCTTLPISLASQKIYKTMTHQNLLGFAEPIGLIVGFLALSLAIFYFVIVPTYIYPGQTLGKKWVGLKIVKTNDQKIDLKTLIIRQVVGLLILESSFMSASSVWQQLVELITNIKIIVPVTYVGAVLGVVTLLLTVFTKENRALHDYLARTKVVMVSRETL